MKTLILPLCLLLGLFTKAQEVNPDTMQHLIVLPVEYHALFVGCMDDAMLARPDVQRYINQLSPYISDTTTATRQSVVGVKATQRLVLDVYTKMGTMQYRLVSKINDKIKQALIPQIIETEYLFPALWQQDKRDDADAEKRVVKGLLHILSTKQ